MSNVAWITLVCLGAAVFLGAVGAQVVATRRGAHWIGDEADRVESISTALMFVGIALIVGGGLMFLQQHIASLPR
ncbi:MAG TPA: hypothetical protein VG248_18985 [Caulobacteraceae bacterium]|jgi:hypothetical protein|nr:hypothetical protein [Caulobacteraceae bacterium]